MILYVILMLVGLVVARVALLGPPSVVEIVAGLIGVGIISYITHQGGKKGGDKK